jgi:disulfide bond formation protein DsbB
VFNLDQTLAALTIIGQVALLLGFALLLIDGRTRRSWVLKLLGRHGLLLAFLAATAAMLISLYYSDVLGYEPCKLCWLQRIFLYPQVLLLGLAIWRKERVVINYSLLLAGVGALLGIYNIYVEQGGEDILNCEAGGGVACTIRYVYEFGYITIPVMALTVTASIIFFLLTAKRY